MLANHVNLRIARSELVSEATWGVPEGSTRPRCRQPKTTRRGAAGLFCGCDRLAGGTVSALNGIDSVAVKLAKERLTRTTLATSKRSIGRS